MSKNTLENLSSELQQKQQELATIQGNLSNQQNQCQLAERQLSQALTQQATLNDQLQKLTNNFQALRHLCDLYREEKGIALNPDIIMTKIISAEDLAHTDILKEACKSRYKEGFDLGLAKITDLDYQDIDGKTILMHAIINGFYSGVDKLLQRGADVNLIDNQGANALIYCADIPHIKYLKQIVEKTTDINHKAKIVQGGAAIHGVMASTGKIMFASELNDELKDVGSIFDNLNKLVADESFTFAGVGNIGVLEFAGDGLTVTIGEPKKEHNNIPANQDKTLRLIKILTEKGADINAQNDLGQTPFFLACIHNFKYLAYEIVNQYELDFNLSDSNGNTSVYFGTSLGEPNVLRLLLFKGVVQAIIDNDNSAIKVFISKGADLSILNTKGNNLWHYVAWFGADKVMESLVAKSSNIDLKAANDEKYTPLWLASQQGHSNIVKWLAEHGADVNIASQVDGTTALQIAIVNNHLPVVKVLVEGCKADINKANLDEVSPLYYSLGYWHQDYKLEITKFLIEHGAIIHKKTVAGDQPIHRASNLADVKAMKLLLDHGASINEVNNDGYTPLHFLVSAENTIEVDKKLTAIKYLLERLASATLKNKEGKSAIDLARDNFPEAQPWLEHPENLPPLSEFEASLVGINDFAI
ncbi:MAG: ankyrin repeat domain-containing protein [Rickettsia endosymbiont of Labidopullus appendiculatus]|nr:ankyrin repeat domain-containing protein [Rickettsia endosymbiont of Labidopullus appendiculatus]